MSFPSQGRWLTCWIDLPTSRMEDGLNFNYSTTDSSLMEPLNQRDQAKSQNEVIARRLKNRERQRRYRARKRLEADSKKAFIVNQSTPTQMDAQANGILRYNVTHVHCQRDWKKDARRAHLLKEQESRSNDPVFPDPASASGIRTPSLSSGVRAEATLNSGVYSRISPSLDSSEMHRITPSRRHWKAEARNQKS